MFNTNNFLKITLKYLAFLAVYYVKSSIGEGGGGIGGAKILQKIIATPLSEHF